MNEHGATSNGWIIMNSLVTRLKGVCYLLVAALVIQLVPAAALAGETKIKVENIRVGKEGDKFVITYDLAGPKEEQYVVKVSLRREGDPKFRLDLESVTGDVGTGSFAGKDRRAVWDPARDFPQGLTGTDFFFVVDAEVDSGGISTWVWIGGGAVAVGLAAVLLGSKKSDESTTTPTGTFPSEPGRPNK